MIRRATLAALFVAASSAAAQSVSPEDVASPAELERARLCRAAAYYHLDGPLPQAAVVPRSVALTIVDQLQFVFAEILLNKPVDDVDKGQALVAFAERWLLGFNRTLVAERGRLADLRERERVLLDCVAWVWSSARSFVDQLLAGRAQSRGDAPIPAPEAIQRQFDDMARRLELKDD